MYGLTEIKKMNEEAYKKAIADKRKILRSLRIACPYCKRNFYPKGEIK